MLAVKIDVSGIRHLAAALADPELDADFRKSQIDYSHISGAEVLRRFTALMKQPPDIQQQLAKYIKFGG